MSISDISAASRPPVLSSSYPSPSPLPPLSRTLPTGSFYGQLPNTFRSTPLRQLPLTTYFLTQPTCSELPSSLPLSRTGPLNFSPPAAYSRGTTKPSPQLPFGPPTPPLFSILDAATAQPSQLRPPHPRRRRDTRSTTRHNPGCRGIVGRYPSFFTCGCPACGTSTSTSPTKLYITGRGPRAKHGCSFRVGAYKWMMSFTAA